MNVDVVALRTRSGWVTFAAILVLLAGGFHIIWGYGALDKEGLFDEASLLIYSNLEFWGWFFIAVGIAQLVTAGLLFARSAAGALLALIGVTLSALIAFLLLLANPEWALVIITLDVIVLWSIFAHIEDFDV